MKNGDTTDFNTSTGSCPSAVRESGSAAPGHRGRRASRCRLGQRRLQRAGVQGPGAETRSGGDARHAVQSQTDGPEYDGTPHGNIAHIKSQGGGQHKTKTPEAKKTSVTFKNLLYPPGHHDGIQEALAEDQGNPGKPSTGNKG